jgi:RNA 3'-terminal phosphate cyclase (ATP)
MLTIDGAAGEGGGQILRTALALSIVTGTPFRIERIRVRRARPGLLRQHLTAVNAAAELSGASVTGAEQGSATLTFAPGRVRPAISNSKSGTRGARLWSCKP